MKTLTLGNILTPAGMSLILLLQCSCIMSENRPHTQPSKTHILIVDGFSNHNWQQTTLLTKQILEASGLFSVEVSTAPSSKPSPDWSTWRPQFANYDVVIQNCNSYGGRPTWPTEVQHNLEKFVRNGGGLYVLHSANNAFPQWEEYNRMIGLGWRKKDSGYAITIEDNGSLRRIPRGQGGNTGHGQRVDAVLTRLGEHPIHRDLPKQWRVADIEIYSYARGPAENLTVLSYTREPETGLNFPVEWIVTYGKGRVYNSTFGHVWEGDTNPQSMRCVAFQTLLIRSVEWLSGKEITWPVPNNFPDDKKVQLQ